MHYPKFLRKLNTLLGKIGGVLCFVVAVMFLVEALLRYVFKSPTSWLTDYGCYLHCLALFLGCAYTFQVKGHVGVDMVRKRIDKASKGAHNRRAARIFAIIGYIQTLMFLGILTYATVKMGLNTVKFHSMTEATFPMPQYIIYAIAAVGCILMIITVFFILLDLFTESQEYID